MYLMPSLRPSVQSRMLLLAVVILLFPLQSSRVLADPPPSPPNEQALPASFDKPRLDAPSHNESLAGLDCDCPCFADPWCDGVADVMDIVTATDVAFRGHPPLQDPQCPITRCDVDCDGYVTVFDIIFLTGVTFRGTDPDVVFCDPGCPTGTPLEPACVPDDPTPDNSVVVESRSYPGLTRAYVGVFVSNNTLLNSIVLPLELRSVSGDAFADGAITLTVSGRLGSVFSWEGTYYFSDPSPTNDCSGPLSLTWTGYSPTPNGDGSPDAVMWYGLSVSNLPLEPGSDGVTPSIVLTMDVNNGTGIFEIDTCCVAPGNHLMFVEDETNECIRPSFTKGVITLTGIPNDPPIAVCRDVSAFAGSGCLAAVSPAEVDNGSSDPDGDPLTLSLSPPGPYGFGENHVWLIVNDHRGGKDSCEAVITVVDNIPPVITCPAVIHVPHDEGACGAVVSFPLQATDDCATADVWSTPAPNSFFPLGETPVTVTASDGNGNESTCHFSVFVAPLADFAATPRCGGDPLEITFTDLTDCASSTSAWDWDFGDGHTSGDQHPVHEYTGPGSYDVTLVTWVGTAADTVIKRDYIIVQDSLTAQFLGLPRSGHAPLTVMFEPTGGSATKHHWWFGDGDEDTVHNPIHVYTEGGVYDVTLGVIQDIEGCDLGDTLTKTAYIMVSDLAAAFSAAPTGGVVPLTGAFTDQSSGSPISWEWDFGDGDVSFDQNPVHEYTDVGTFDVSLKVTDLVGADSLLKLGYIIVEPEPTVDLSCDLYAGDARPGFNCTFLPAWTNLQTGAATNTVLKVLLPSEVTFLSISVTEPPATGSYSGYSWSEDTLVIPLGTVEHTPWVGGYLEIYANLPPSVPPGTILTAEAWLSCAIPETDTLNNYAPLELEVRASIDPNLKSADPRGTGPTARIAPGRRLHYKIEFENKAEATAEAIYVLVIDTLDPDLDWSTLVVGTMSHPGPCSWHFDPYTGELVWFWNGIMLPPNVDPPEGEGFVTYAVSPKAGLPDGTEITNRTYIRFDYNEFITAPEGGPLVRTISLCACNCHADPQCDEVTNVFDVVHAVNVAFRGGSDIFDPLPGCPYVTTDVDCDGVTNVLDVVHLVNVAFRSNDPALEFCDPCAP